MISAIANPQSAAVAAPGWQFVFMSLAIVVLLLEIIHGWRLGLVRQLVRVIAIVVAYSCAFFAAQATVPFMHSFFKLPDPILAVLGGAILAAILFAAVNLIGAFLFKKTAQQESRSVRLIWGSTGAFLGILLGLFTIWLGFAGIRMVGSVAEARLRTQNLPASSTAEPNGPAQIQREAPASPSPNPLMAMLAEMKSSLESGKVGEAVRTIDPLPPSLYRLLEKAGEVASNVQSTERFLSFPGAHEISEHPKVVALRNDPRVAALIANGHIFELMKDQRMIEAMNDPALQGRVKKFDLERALDYALKKNSSH
jgi:Colicin V production protein